MPSFAHPVPVRHRNIAALRHKFKGSDDEWAAILSHFLLQQPPEGAQAALLRGVRMLYTLKNGRLGLLFRQDIHAIKVRTYPPRLAWLR